MEKLIFSPRLDSAFLHCEFSPRSDSATSQMSHLCIKQDGQLGKFGQKERINTRRHRCQFLQMKYEFYNYVILYILQREDQDGSRGRAQLGSALLARRVGAQQPRTLSGLQLKEVVMMNIIR